MLVKILKPFAYAANGIRSRDLAEGAVEEVHDNLVSGLVAEGYVVAPDGITAPAVDDEFGPAEVVDRASPPDPYPHLSPAQETALDRDGDSKPGGAPRGGNRKRKAR